MGPRPRCVEDPLMTGVWHLAIYYTEDRDSVETLCCADFFLGIESLHRRIPTCLRCLTEAWLLASDCYNDSTRRWANRWLIDGDL